MSDNAENIVQRNLFYILGHLFPSAVLSHRSALEFRPTAANYIFLTYTYTKKVRQPGVVLNFMEGPGPVAGVNLMAGSLHVSQQARAFLENMEVARKKGPRSKIIDPAELEERIEQIIRVKGEEGLNAIRDQARELSAVLGKQKEFEKLDRLMGALLSTRPADQLKSSVALARALRNPYDPARWKLFESLFVALKKSEFPARPDKDKTETLYHNFSFYEAYFSNYIEGTVFEIEEALHIIETNTPMAARHEDSHDILGTYSLVSN